MGIREFYFLMTGFNIALALWNVRGTKKNWDDAIQLKEMSKAMVAQAEKNVTMGRKLRQIESDMTGLKV